MSAAVAASGVAGWALTDASWALVALAALPAGAAAWAWQRLQARRPLELARVAVSHGGVVLVRARLGTGRLAEHAAATVVWEHDGVSTPLPTWSLPPLVAGPFTVCAPLLPGRVLDRGQLRVSLRCEEAGRAWQIEGVYPAAALVHGRFAPPLVRRGRSWELVSRGWDRVEPLVDAAGGAL